MSALSCNTASGLLSPPLSPRENDSGPYPAGRSLTIRSHIPATPCGRKYRTSRASKSAVPTHVSQLQWCLTHEPRPGQTDVNPKTREITCKSLIRTGYGYGAQVIRTEDGLVAKIYDPLYYAFAHEGRPNKKIDVAAEADHDYTIEANSYLALFDSGLPGSVMPQFYGSWTMDVQTYVDGQQHIRKVRLILLEYISGTSMMDIDPRQLSKEQREIIMFKVIEASTDLRLAGLEHNDFKPRNIMLLVSPEAASIVSSSFLAWDHSGLRVCVIDYGRSYAHSVACKAQSRCQYRNPLFYWAGRDIYCQYGWLPPNKEATDWMWETWGNGGRNGKYISVERDPEDALGLPVHPES